MVLGMEKTRLQYEDLLTAAEWRCEWLETHTEHFLTPNSFEPKKIRKRPKKKRKKIDDFDFAI